MCTCVPCIDVVCTLVWPLHQLVSQITPTDEIMASCYSFSLKARLSPKWNRVNTWLVQGW